MLPLLTWLVQGAVGPALVGLPVTWGATELAGAAKRWFRRLRRSDGLSRIVRAAAGGDADLSDAEFAAVRHVLELESTWVLVGQGTVEDLVDLVAKCLPDRRDGEALAAGRGIARGLLEFAVRDLEPEWFQQVLFARLARMQADQASALDRAVLGAHADLAALFAAQDAADADRSARLLGLLSRVLDRLPPGTADQGEVAIYLATLIRWLDSDPWPQDTRFGGPALTPAVVERKLRIATARSQVQDVDADQLGRLCSRLVVLGGPGSGKTWFARRTARLCAEAALQALVGGAVPGEVELPLYTTCARLAAVPPGGSIRRVVVSSAFDQLPDLGCARVTDAVRALFEERDAPTLFVVDSLDEARGLDDRVRLADSLPPTWRIIITSRPATWNGQLAIADDDPAQRVGTLQPLRYPDDVEPFITRWFSTRPQWAADLAAQLRDRPAMQEAATVPLILAFYCIVGGGQPLSGRRADLYGKVIRRMLIGRWRGGASCDPDPDVCLETLRKWAWSAEDSNPVSGVGTWADEFSTPRVRQSRDDQEALDHVAVPVGPADPDTWRTPRRFVHRSIREHLVAEHIALAMPADQAAAELLNHLWYDVDWEHAAPAALAMHRHRDQILMDLVRRVTGGGHLYENLTAIDGCGEIRRFLARAALESAETDWSREAAELIGQARMDLANSEPEYFSQVMASDWPASNRSIRRSLLAQLADAPATDARELAALIAALDPIAEEQARAREALLRLLADESRPTVATELAELIVRFEPVAEDRLRARRKLLHLLVGADPQESSVLVEAIARLTVTAEERAQVQEALLASASVYALLRGDLGEAVTRFTVTAEERAQVREAVLALLGDKTWPWLDSLLVDVIARLAVTAQEQARTRDALLELLASEIKPVRAQTLARAIADLDPATEDRARARDALLGLLDREADREHARGLAEAIARLAVTAEDRAEARDALLRLLPSETGPWMARRLTSALARLAVTAEERAQARDALLRLLAREDDFLNAGDLAKGIIRLAVTAEERAQAREALLGLLDREANASVAEEVAEAIAGLDPTVQDQAQTRESLLRLLNTETELWRAQRLIRTVARLQPTSDDRARARETLLRLLDVDDYPGYAEGLAEQIADLDPTAEDQARARAALLQLLSDGTGYAPVPWLTEAIARFTVTAEDRATVRDALLRLLDREASTFVGPDLAEAIADLDPTAGDLARARSALLRLLGLLDREADWAYAVSLPGAVVRLTVTAQDRAQARDALLGPLDHETHSLVAEKLAEAVADLDPTAEDLAWARDALLRLLDREANTFVAPDLAKAVADLDPTAGDLARARAALLGLLCREASPWTAGKLAETLARLHPTVADLGDSGGWPVPPAPPLLAAARQHSELAAWLAALPRVSKSGRLYPSRKRRGHHLSFDP